MVSATIACLDLKDVPLFCVIMARCEGVRKQGKLCALTSVMGAPSLAIEATTALAVPEVSAFCLWCDSVTSNLYPENAPGNSLAMSSSVA